MPVQLRFGPRDLLRCRFAVSPLCETHEAVRLLRRGRRHGYHVPWLRRMREAARGLDLAGLWLLMPAPSGYTPDFLGPPPLPSGRGGGDPAAATFAAELARVRATDPSLAREEIARSLACTPGAAGTPRGRALLADPERAVRELADATERAWERLLAPEWPRLSDLLLGDIAFRARQLAEAGLEAAFTDLWPELTWADDMLSVRTPYPGTVVQELGGRGVLLMPSAFVRPDVVSGFAPPWQPTVIYPARGAAATAREAGGAGAGARRALERLLGSSRAAVLSALDGPASTTALAGRLGLAASSVSAHLTALRDAGLLTSYRVRHRVLYARTPLGSALLEGGRGAAG